MISVCAGNLLKSTTYLNEYPEQSGFDSNNCGITRKIYQQYRASGYDQSLLDLTYADIALHKAATPFSRAPGLWVEP